MCFSNILPIVNTLIAISGVSFALYQYQKQRVFNRIKNLSSIWEQFTDKTDILELFVLCNNVSSGDTDKLRQLKEKDQSTKFKFLAMLEEVAIYSEVGQVDLKYAVEYFQWHFYFVYKDQKTSDAFWSNIGGDEEKNSKDSWKRQRKIADIADQRINN